MDSFKGVFMEKKYDIDSNEIKKLNRLLKNGWSISYCYGKKKKLVKKKTVLIEAWLEQRLTVIELLFLSLTMAFFKAQSILIALW